MKYNLALWIFSWTILVVCLQVNSQSYYKTYYMEDHCVPFATRPPTYIAVGHSRSDSSGILKTANFPFYSRGLNCTVVLYTVPGNGITISIRRLQFRNSHCEDILKINSVTECAQGFVDSSESRSYTFSGNVTIIFRSANRGWRNDKGFQLIFTSYSNSTSEGLCNETDAFQCANKHCIWSGLKCDGHNNCGDKSDEGSYGNCGFRVSYVGLAISLLVLIALIAAVVYCCRRRRITGTVITSPLTAPDVSAPASYGTYNAAYPTGYPPAPGFQPQAFQQGPLYPPTGPQLYPYPMSPSQPPPYPPYPTYPTQEATTQPPTFTSPPPYGLKPDH